MHVSNVVYQRTARKLLVNVGTVLAGMVIFLAGGILLGGLGALLGIALAIVGGTFLNRRFAVTRIPDETSIEVDAHGIRIPEINLSLPRSKIQGGLESALDRTVVLDIDGGSLQFQLPERDGEDRGEHVLQTLGLNEWQRTVRVPLRRMLGRFSIGFVTFFGSVFLSAFLLPFIHNIAGISATPATAMGLVTTMATLFTIAMVVRFGSPHVVLGNDGIRTKGVWPETFVPYSEIANVEVVGQSPAHQAAQNPNQENDLTRVIIHRHKKPPLELPMIAIGRHRVQGLFERIQRARKLGGDAPTRLNDALARAGKPLDKWRDELTQLANRQANFREAAIQKEEIESVLVDPKANAEQRIGAAFVLQRIDPEVGKERIRIAAEATAEDDLRAALLAAAEGEIESEAVKRTAR